MMTGPLAKTESTQSRDLRRIPFEPGGLVFCRIFPSAGRGQLI